MYAQTNACCMIVYHWAYLLYRTNTHTYASTYGHTFGRIRTSYCMFSWNHVKHHLNSMYGIITTQYNLPFISSTLCLFAHKQNPFDISHARTNTHGRTRTRTPRKKEQTKTNEHRVWHLVACYALNHELALCMKTTPSTNQPKHSHTYSCYCFVSGKI